MADVPNGGEASASPGPAPPDDAGEPSGKVDVWRRLSEPSVAAQNDTVAARAAVKTRSFARLSLDRVLATSTAKALDETIDAHFEDFLSISAPLLPVQTLFINFHIMQKRARQFIDDARYFALQQLVWLLTALLMLLLPKSFSSGWLYVSEIFFALVLAMSSFEMIVYVMGHGFFAGAKYARTAQQLRILAVLRVWSPPRFRRKGEVGSHQYHVQIPLMSNPFMRMELCLILLSILGYFFDSNGFGRVRYVHGLRCARLIYGLSNIWPQLVRVIATFQASFSGLSTAMVLLIFFFVLFGIAGIDQFSNSLSSRCVLQKNAVPYEAYNRSTICLDGTSSGSCIEAEPMLFCDPSSDSPSFVAPFVCRGNMVCRQVDPPNSGYTSFDDIFHASLLMLQMTSLTDWSTFLNGLWGSNPKILAGAFCAVLIIIVSYVVLNFVVATICSAYSENRSTNSRNKLHTISALNFRLTEFVWWTISVDAQYHLSYRNPDSKRPNKRTPFFCHRNYLAARDVWLLGIVASHASLTASSSDGHVGFLRAIEVVNVIVFGMDVVVSIVASGSIGKYLVVATHRFDLLAFLLTIVGLALGIPLSVFRFALAGHWLTRIPILQRSRVLQQALKAAPGTLVASLVMLLLLFVSASVAVQLFSVHDGPTNDWSDSWEAIVTLFRFVTLDGWSSIMYDAMNSRGAVLGLGFFLPTYLMFGYMVRGLFTSVVVDAFDPNNDEKLSWQRRMYRSARKQVSQDPGAGGEDGGAFVAFASTMGTTAQDGSIKSAYEDIDDRRVVVDTSFFYFRLTHPIRRWLLKLVTVPSELQLPDHMALQEDQTLESLIPYRCYGNFFQGVIILFVIGSCITAADPPNESCSTRDEELKAQYAFTSYLWLDSIIVAVFTIEMILKMIAQGVIMKGDDRPWYVGTPYLKDSWNILDLILLVIMYVSFFYQEVSALRLMRILRPLRIIRRFRRMRLLMQGVVSSMPGVFVTLLCGAVMLFLFAIVGVAKFRGQMYACTAAEIGDTIVVTQEDCFGMQLADNGVLTHSAWEGKDPSFDSVIDGMSYLIQIISLSSWTELLARATSVTGVGMQPKVKSELQNSLFFFVFVILANSFLLNVIVGIVVAAFDEQRGLRFLTLQQRMYKSLLEAIESFRPIPPPPSSRFPRILALVRWPAFDGILIVVVLMNILVLVSSHANQSDNWTSGQFYLNTIFTFIFIAEASLKLLALGKHYFADAWNNVDFIIVIGSVVEFSIQVASSGQAVTITSVGRAFRILRVFRSVRRIPSLHMMFITLASSTPAILSIFGVMIMVVFMYSVVGMQMFGQLRFQLAISNDANFRDFLTAWFTVFRMLTLDGWDGMMRDATSYVGELCNHNQEGWWYLNEETGAPTSCGNLNDCGSLVSARLYFFSFYILSAFIFSSVVIAILLDSFRLNSSSTRAAVRRYDLEGFRVAWLKARRAVGEENFYGSYIEKELMSLLCIELFNDNNGLVLNRVTPERHVHPVITSRSRLNFRKVVYELDSISHHRREQLAKKKQKATAADGSARDTPQSNTATPTMRGDAPSAFADADPLPDDEGEDAYPLNKYEFHDVMECLCRFQMGPDALAMDQKFLRETFEDKMNVVLFGRHIKSSLLGRLREARDQLSLYNLQDAPNLTKSDEDGKDGGARNESDGDGDEITPSIDHVREAVSRQHSTLTFRPSKASRQNSALVVPSPRSVVRLIDPLAPSPQPRIASNTTTPTRNMAATAFVAAPETPEETPSENSFLEWDPSNVEAANVLPLSAAALLFADESSRRTALYREGLVSLDALFRRYIEVVEMWVRTALLSECKTAWLHLLLERRRPQSSLRSFAHQPTIQAPTVRLSTVPSASGAMPSSSVVVGRRNPIASLDVPVLMCSDDANCPLYKDRQHTAMRRHTCRLGERCHDFSSEHENRFLHKGDRWQNAELSSDDEMIEIPAFSTRRLDS